MVNEMAGAVANSILEGERLCVKGSQYYLYLVTQQCIMTTGAAQQVVCTNPLGIFRER